MIMTLFNVPLHYDGPECVSVGDSPRVRVARAWKPSASDFSWGRMHLDQKKEVCNVVTSQASVTIIPKKNLIADKRKTDLTCTSSKMLFFFDVCKNKNKNKNPHS